MSRAEELTEEQWAVIEHLLLELQPREDAGGRPPADTRAVLNGVLWAMRTGADRVDLPERYPPYQTCHRRFQAWQGDQDHGSGEPQWSSYRRSHRK